MEDNIRQILYEWDIDWSYLSDSVVEHIGKEIYSIVKKEME